MLKETLFIITFCSSAARSLKWLYPTESDKLSKSVDYLKHEIFDDPVELAPFVALALWLFGKLYKILDSLEINERYNLGRLGASFLKPLELFSQIDQSRFFQQPRHQW